MTAEAEAVVHGGGDIALDRHVGRVVQVADGIGIDEVDRGWHNVVVNSERGENHLDAAAGTQRVAQMAFGTRDSHRVSMLAVHGLHGLRFGFVAQRRAGAVSVDVIDFLDRQLGIAQRVLHGSSSARAFGIGLRDVCLRHRWLRNLALRHRCGRRGLWRVRVLRRSKCRHLR